MKKLSRGGSFTGNHGVSKTEGKNTSGKRGREYAVNASINTGRALGSRLTGRQKMQNDRKRQRGYPQRCRGVTEQKRVNLGNDWLRKHVTMLA